MNDPVVEEVRAVRERILAECEGDLDRMIARLKSAESNASDKRVTFEEVQKRKRVAATAQD